MIRTACPSCRATLTLDADDVVLAIGREPPATYTISCPDCGAVSVKRADSLAEWLLRAAGVVAVPIARLDPVRLPGSPLLSFDDLLDLYLLLVAAEHVVDPLANGIGTTVRARSADAFATDNAHRAGATAAARRVHDRHFGRGQSCGPA